MKEILKDHKRIIINTDIDGFLSGLILKNYLNCEIVGFCNSLDSVWFDKTKISSIYDAVYVDMFVPQENVITIDQHIIAINRQHQNILKSNPNKINPNIENPRLFHPQASYVLKYPLGTIHFICATLEKEGIHIHFDLNDQKDGLRLGDLILRADDAMNTSLNSNYSENASSWWEWLLDYSNRGLSIQGFINFLNETPRSAVCDIKEKTKKLFTSSPFYCESADGGYKAILNENGALLQKVLLFMQYLAYRTNLDMPELSPKYTLQKGVHKKISICPCNEKELINNQTINQDKVFSYSFVYGENRQNNFSYTIM